MKRLLIVFHSLTGGTRQMAEAAAEAASGEVEVEVQLIRAIDACADHVLANDGYIFATPENLGTMAGLMKDFFDRTYYDVLDRVAGRPYGLMICAGSDGENTARQVGRIVTGWRLRAIADPIIICTHAQTPETIFAPKSLDEGSLAPCRDLGLQLATGLALGVF